MRRSGSRRLAKLAADAPDYRQSIYQMVADRMGEVATVAGLPAFGKAVFAAKWMTEKKYEQALSAAESLDRQTASHAGYLNRDADLLQGGVSAESQADGAGCPGVSAAGSRLSDDKRAEQAAQLCMFVLSRDKEAIDSAAGRRHVCAGRRDPAAAGSVDS